MTLFSTHRFILQTLDPLHVGAGGTVLGRVDLSIVREPGTHLPKIPGSSLSGAVRQYAAYQYNKPTCAGQKDHCAQPTCPICYTFGTANEAQGGGYRGVVSFHDARLLLFPVYSMAGPVWITSPGVLAAFGLPDVPRLSANQALFASQLSGLAHLNLGWLMVTRSGEYSAAGLPESIPAQVRQRVVVAPDALFGQVVNANLEVRTSVSIDPETGAAEDGALFTHESIPRAAYLWMELVEHDYRQGFAAVSQKHVHNGEEAQRLPSPWNSPLDVVTAGLGLAEHLGVGGMGTRGFGRVKAWEV